MPRQWSERGVAGIGEALFICQLRRVVVLAKVTQENVLQSRVVEDLYGHGALLVGQMTLAAPDSCLKFRRIWTEAQHFGVVIAFYNHRIGLAGPVEGFLGNSADVGHYNKLIIVQEDGVSYGLGGVVGHGKAAGLNASRNNVVPSSLAHFQTIIVNLVACHGVTRQRPVQLFGRPHRLSYMLAE